MSSEPRHLHPAAMLLEALSNARNWVSAAVIPGLAALFGSGLNRWVVALILGGAILLLVGSAVWGFLSWRATSYWVSGGAFHLRRGVLQKNERTIPLEHVQSVDTVQGLVQRIIGLAGAVDVVEVRVETAGGGASEPDASLTAVSRDAAEALRRELSSTRREEAEEEPGPTVIRRLGTRELLIAGATSGQIGAAAALIAAASQLFDNFLDRFISESVARSFLDALAPHAFAAVALLVLGVGLLAWLLAIGGTVLAYAGFTLSRSADGKYLHIRRGLLSRYEATIPISRIQAVQIVEGILRQPFGLAFIRVESAGYGADSGVSTTLFPLLPRKQVKSLLEATAPEFAVEADLKPLPARALRRYVFRAAFPVLVIALVAAAGIWFALEAALWALLPLLFPIPFALHGALQYRAAGWGLAKDCLLTRSRILARTTSIAPRRRLQSRSIVRSPFQRRARLATLRARVASGGGGAQFEVVDLESTSAEILAENLGPRLWSGLQGR